jgi:MarR family transcriptional regulator, organic hydroperoxide resistance regulator
LRERLGFCKRPCQKSLDIGLISNYVLDMDHSTRRLISHIAVVRDKANAFISKRLTDHGIKQIAPAHGSVFYQLFDVEELTMGRIAAQVHRDKSTVTALVNRLVELGYAEKRKSLTDARATHVRLTDKGLAMKPVFDKISDELLETAYRGFSPEEEYILIRLLERAIANFANDETKTHGD